MSKLFFQIGVKDLTPYEDIQNHDVNKVEIFQSWTDGNWIERRAVIRSRIEGRVTLGFASAEDFQEFTVLLNSQRQADGFYYVTVYVQNTGETASIEAYVEPQGAAKWDIVNSRQWITQTLTITER